MAVRHLELSQDIQGQTLEKCTINHRSNVHFRKTDKDTKYTVVCASNNKKFLYKGKCYNKYLTKETTVFPIYTASLALIFYDVAVIYEVHESADFFWSYTHPGGASLKTSARQVIKNYTHLHTA